MRHLLVIIERKEIEERLAAMHWSAPREEQVAFLRAAGYPVNQIVAARATDEHIRQTISHQLAILPDSTLGALAQEWLVGHVSQA